MRILRSFLPVLTLLSVAGSLGAACSSNDSDKSLASAGGSGAVGNGGKGGSSKGGSGNAAKGGGSAALGGTSSGSGGSGNATNTGGSGNATSTGGSANAGSGGTGNAPTDACEGLPFESGGQGGAGSDVCTGVASEAESVPVDLFIMMDRSISMNESVEGTTMTRWEALQAALQAFVESSTHADIRAGIGFFGLTGGNDDTLDCNPSNYSTPKVEIGELASVGSDLVAAMGDITPGGLTPAGPALTGALAHAADWAKDNPGRATAVVLVTDGYPTQCEPQTVSGLASLAETAHLNAPYVRTYVVGLGSTFNLDAIALSGGTHSAFHVDEGDITHSFVSALQNVANTKLACNYGLPPSPDPDKKLDFTKVQVVYTPGSDDSTEEIPALPGPSSCSEAKNGGWYYDDSSDPTSILVCPCTCARFGAGRVDVRVGCKPRIGVR